MENLSLTNLNKNLTTNSYVFDGSDFKDATLSFIVNKGQNVSVLFLNIPESLTIDFNVQSSSNVKFSFLQESASNMLIKGNVEEGSNLTCYFADFVKGDINLQTDIHLIGEGATCNWNLASLTKDNDKKEFDVSLYHNAKRTYCEINNYGVARDKSRLLFSGICKIENGAHASVAHQNSKIMVFDEESDGVAKPILKIDDNDIEASHAAVVGKISDDHLFYMTSRGLSVNEARELITYGYLKPILNGFENEELQKRINALIERGL